MAKVESDGPSPIRAAVAPRHICGSTYAILSRQGGAMSCTRDDLGQSSCDRRRTAHAALARSHHTGLSPVRTTLFAACLAPCAGLAPGSDARTWCTHGDGRLAGHGAELRTSLHQRPSRLEPGQLVAPPGWSH